MTEYTSKETDDALQKIAAQWRKQTFDKTNANEAIAAFASFLRAFTGRRGIAEWGINHGQLATALGYASIPTEIIASALVQPRLCPIGQCGGCAACKYNEWLAGSKMSFTHMEALPRYRPRHTEAA